MSTVSCNIRPGFHNYRMNYGWTVDYSRHEFGSWHFLWIRKYSDYWLIDTVKEFKYSITYILHLSQRGTRQIWAVFEE